MPQGRNLKVAVVAETFPKLSETFVVNHVRGLLEAGVEVDIYAFYGQQERVVDRAVADHRMLERTHYKPFEPLGKPARVKGALGILSRHLWRHPGALLSSLDVFRQGVEALRLHRLYEAATFMDGKRYDIVHCHFATTAEKVALFQGWGLMQAPLVTSFHGYELDDRRVVHEGMYQELPRRGQLFVANSGYTRGRLLDFGFDASRIIVLPVCLDTRFFTRRTQPPIKPFHLLSVGRLVAFKGFEYSLRAVARVRDLFAYKLFYTIVGSGPLEAHLRELISELGLEEQVRMMGDRTPDEIQALMEQSHVFLLTGIRDDDGRVENQGLVLQEAQSMELPVIAGNLGGVSEGLVDGQTGFLVREKDVDAIADRIRQLYENPDRLVSMGRSGRAFVENRYSIKNHTQTIISQYGTLLT